MYRGFAGALCHLSLVHDGGGISTPRARTWVSPVPQLPRAALLAAGRWEKLRLSVIQGLFAWVPPCTRSHWSSA